MDLLLQPGTEPTELGPERTISRRSRTSGGAIHAPGADPAGAGRRAAWRRGCRSSPAGSRSRRFPTDVRDATGRRTRRSQRPPSTTPTSPPSPPPLRRPGRRPPQQPDWPGCCRSDTTTPIPDLVQHDHHRTTPVQVDPYVRSHVSLLARSNLERHPNWRTYPERGGSTLRAIPHGIIDVRLWRSLGADATSVRRGPVRAGPSTVATGLWAKSAPAQWAQRGSAWASHHVITASVGWCIGDR